MSERIIDGVYMHAKALTDERDALLVLVGELSELFIEAHGGCNCARCVDARPVLTRAQSALEGVRVIQLGECQIRERGRGEPVLDSVQGETLLVTLSASAEAAALKGAPLGPCTVSVVVRTGGGA